MPDLLTLGDFLAAAKKRLCSSLPTPGRKQHRQPLNFMPLHGHFVAAFATTKTAAPPTSECCGHVQILRTLGIIGMDQVIIAEAIKPYDGMFAALICNVVLARIVVPIPNLDPTTTPITTVIVGMQIEA